MLPEAAISQDDPSSHLNSLQRAIESTLRAARRSADQTERGRKLRVEDAANKEAERKSGAPLFKIPSRISSEMLKESGPLGDYLRALFHLLFLPIRPPRAEIVAPAGMGKTRECVTQLRLLAGRRVYYFVPTHDLVQQLVSDLQEAGYCGVHPVQGRTVPGMCELDDIAELSRDIATAGLSVQSVLCGNPEKEDSDLCSHFHKCKYQAQRLALGTLSPPPDQPLTLPTPDARPRAGNRHRRQSP